MKRFWIPVDQNNQNIAQIVVVLSGETLKWLGKP